MTEQTIVEACARFFRRRGYNVRREVPIQRKVADLYCVNNRDGHCATVEGKLRDWGRALSQAQVHQLGADYSYIALPPASISGETCSRARKFGIGILSVDDRGKVTVLLEARMSQYVRRAIRRRALVTIGPKVGAACLME